MGRPLTYSYGGATHVGLRRTENQDSFGRFPRSEDARSDLEQLFLVADGMGGQRGGREASQIAVHMVEEAFFGDRTGTLSERLRRAILAANEAIHDQAEADDELRDMGTTCTALVLRGREASVGHVGDSRLYRVSDAGLEQLTKDHTRVEKMVEHNIITPEEAAVHPERNVLSRALGVRREVEVDVEGLAVSPGESYLICSDGLAGVPKGEIETIVRNYPPQEACDLLVQRANDNGGFDNVTVQIIRIEQAPKAPIRRRSRVLVLLGALVAALVLYSLLF